MDLLFASNNKGKFLELEEDFKKEGINLVFDGNLNLVEDDETLRGNAYSKAKYAALEKHLPAIGDDSGVFIESLEFFPGVHSRRWMSGSDEERNQKILELMKNEQDRTAYLVSYFVVVDKNGNKIFATKVKNEFRISESEHGDKGFGYDKILIKYPAMEDEKSRKRKILKYYCENKTIADLPQEEKNYVNNRGRIAKEIKSFFDANPNLNI